MRACLHQMRPEQPFIAAVRVTLNLSWWPADLLNKCESVRQVSLWVGQVLLPVIEVRWGSGSSEDSTVLTPDCRSRPCIYPNWPIFPPACRPCLHVNGTNSGAVHSEVSEVPSLGWRSSDAFSFHLPLPTSPLYFHLLFFAISLFAPWTVKRSVPACWTWRDNVTASTESVQQGLNSNLFKLCNLFIIIMQSQ